MAQSFSSFKELLIKKKLSDKDERSVRYDVLSRIFLTVSEKLIKNNIKHFGDEEKKVIHAVLDHEDVKNKNENLSKGEYEALVRNGLQELSDETKLLLLDLLEEECKKAEKENKKIETLAKKYKPKDLTEEYEHVKGRIKELENDIIEIEMSLMVLEKEEQQGTKGFKKKQDARERRKQLINKLEKQKQSIEKKLKLEK